MCRSLSLFALLSALFFSGPAFAQVRQVSAADSCYATATARQFRDNEFSRYSSEPVFAGSIGVGCDLVELKGLPLGLRMTFGVYGEIMETAPITIQSAQTGDPLTKRLGTMGFVGGTGELQLPTFGAFTPSILLRYGVDVGTIVPCLSA